MSGPKHLPIIAWDRRELVAELRHHQRGIQAIEAELERRGDRNDQRWGFPVPVQERPGVIGTAYAHYPTPTEAREAALEAFPEDHDAAPYRVHAVFLGKDDPA